MMTVFNGFLWILIESPRWLPPTLIQLTLALVIIICWVKTGGSNDDV
jgi:hypothetical protein